MLVLLRKKCIECWKNTTAPSRWKIIGILNIEKTNEIRFGIHLDYIFCVEKGNVNRNETKIASSSLETRNLAVYTNFRATFD